MHKHTQTEEKRFPFNAGMIISETKHAEDAVKISGSKTDICRVSESVILPDGQESAGVGVCVLGGLSAPLYSGSNPFSFMPDKVIHPTCQW